MCEKTYLNDNPDGGIITSPARRRWIWDSYMEHVAFGTGPKG